jgi:hypothetical protein
MSLEASWWSGEEVSGTLFNDYISDPLWNVEEQSDVGLMQNPYSDMGIYNPSPPADHNRPVRFVLHF